MAIDVLLYHSGMSGAPGANLRVAGGLTDLLNACLVDGFNVRTITGITRSGTTATATVSGSNPWQIGFVVEIAGADQAAYNGRQRVTARTDSTISFEVTGSPVTPATGTITAKSPGAGWTKSSLGTNRVAYRTKVPGSEGHWMQVEDDNPYTDSNVGARTRMAVNLTGLDTADQLGEQCRIQKGSSTGWVLVADGRSCYVVMSASDMLCFGEAQSFLGGDQYAFFQNRGENASTNASVFGTTSTTGRVFPGIGAANDLASASLAASWLRSYTQIGGHVSGFPMIPSFLGNNAASGSKVDLVQGSSMALPPSVDDSIAVFPVLLAEVSGQVRVRGAMRGCYLPLARLDTIGFANNIQMLDDVTINGDVRKLAVCRFCASGLAQIAFDVGDSWD